MSRGHCHYSSVPHLCASPLGARVGYRKTKSEVHTRHKTWVPYPRDVFVFVARVGDRESHPFALTLGQQADE